MRKLLRLIQMALGALPVTAVAACQETTSGPVKSNTVKIVYSTHTNSGTAIQTSFTIFEDSLVWNYNELRNECHLSDAAHYDAQAFKALLAELSAIEFSAKDAHDYSTGGSGWGISFENAKGRYLSFNNTFKLSGDYQKVAETILRFVNQHQPRGLQLFKHYQHQPHRPAAFGEFEQLPEALLPYANRKK